MTTNILTGTQQQRDVTAFTIGVARLLIVGWLVAVVLLMASLGPAPATIGVDPAAAPVPAPTPGAGLDL